MRISKTERYRVALALLANRFLRIKPTSRTALYIESVLGPQGKKCKACGHLVSMRSPTYGYCVHHLASGEFCKCSW